MNDELRDEAKKLILKIHDETLIENFDAIGITTCQECNFRLKLCQRQEKQCPFNSGYGNIDSDTYWTPESWNIILEGVYLAKMMVTFIANNRYQHGYALVRPPSHHCTSRKASGFCPINITVTTAKYILDHLSYEKVLILDFDYHHGDGTESFLSSIDNLYYASIHAYGKGFVFPGTGEAHRDERKCNVPIDLTATFPEQVTDDFYWNLIETQIIPFVTEVDPNFIIISHGLDGHQSDPLAGFNLTDSIYFRIAEWLFTYNVPLFYILEGGYNLEAIYRVTKGIINILN